MPALTRAARKAASMDQTTTEPAASVVQADNAPQKKSSKQSTSSKSKGNNTETHTEIGSQTSTVPVTKPQAGKGRPKKAQAPILQQDVEPQLQRESVVNSSFEQLDQRTKQNTVSKTTPITISNRKINTIIPQTLTTIPQKTKEESSENKEPSLEATRTSKLDRVGSTADTSGIRAVVEVGTNNDRLQNIRSRTAKIEARLVPQDVQTNRKALDMVKKPENDLSRTDDRNLLRIKKTRSTVTKQSGSTLEGSSAHDTDKVRDKDLVVQNKGEKGNMSVKLRSEVATTSKTQSVVTQKAAYTNKTNKTRATSLAVIAKLGQKPNTIGCDNKENGENQPPDFAITKSPNKHGNLRIPRHKSVPNLRSRPPVKIIPYQTTKHIIEGGHVNQTSSVVPTSTNTTNPLRQARNISTSTKVVSQEPESPRRTMIVERRTPSPTKMLKFKPGPVIPNTRATLLRAQVNALVRRKSCPSLQDDPASPERKVVSPNKFTTINKDYMKRCVSSVETSTTSPFPLRAIDPLGNTNQLDVPAAIRQVTELEVSPQTKSILPRRNVTQPAPFAFSGGGHSVKAAILRAERLQKKDNEEQLQSLTPHKDLVESSTTKRYEIHGPTGKPYSQLEAQTKPRSKSVSTISSKSLLRPVALAATKVSAPRSTPTIITLAPPLPTITAATSTPKRTTIFDRLSTPKHVVKRASSAHNLRGNASHTATTTTTTTEETIILAEAYKDNRDLSALQPSTPIRITMTEEELTTIQKEKIRLEASLRGHQALIQWQASQSKKEMVI